MAVAEAPPEVAPDDLDPKKSLLEQLKDKWPYDFAIVPLAGMFADKYQRPTTSLKDEIAADFNPFMIGAVCLSERRGGRKSPKGPKGEPFAVVDGNNRRVGATEAGVDRLPATIFQGMTPQEEAIIFADLQRKRRNNATYNRFIAELFAGREHAVGIAGVLGKYGYEVGAKGQAHEKRVQAVAALEYCWHADPVYLEETIQTLDAAWGHDDELRPKAVSAEMIRGMFSFLREEPRDMNRLAKRLVRVNPADLEDQANLLRRGYGGKGSVAKYMADAILGVYSRR